MITGLIDALNEVGASTPTGIFFQQLARLIASASAKGAKTVALTITTAQLNALPLGVTTPVVAGGVGTDAIITGYTITASNPIASAGTLEVSGLNLAGNALGGALLPFVLAPGGQAVGSESVGYIKAAPSDTAIFMLKRTVGTFAPGANVTITLYLAPS